MSTRNTALVLCLIAAGCGGSSSSSSSPATSSASAPVTTQTTTTPTPNFQPVTFETLDEGDQSPRGFAQGAHELHVATDPDWQTFWPTHSTTRPPLVDFTSNAVVGTYMGTTTSGIGHWSRVIGVERDLNSDDLRVTVREFRLGAWRPHASVLSAPFHLARCETVVSGQGTLTVAPRQTELDFEAVAAGSNSAIGAGDPTYTGGLHVFRDATAFASFYGQVQPGAVPPRIDFRNEMAVVVLAAYIPSFGNTVETLRLVHDSATDEIRIRRRVNPYRGGAAPPPATETPFQVLRVSQATGTIRDEREGAHTVTTLGSGRTNLYVGPEETLIVRDAATFNSLWTSRINSTPPVVDFTTDQVVLSFEPGSAGRTRSVARASLLENDELAVTIHTTLLGGVTRTAYWTAATTPRTFGPVGFETIDVTPRP